MIPGIPTNTPTGAGAGGTYTGDSKGAIEAYQCIKYEVNAVIHQQC